MGRDRSTAIKQVESLVSLRRSFQVLLLFIMVRSGGSHIVLHYKMRQPQDDDVMRAVETATALRAALQRSFSLQVGLHLITCRPMS